jgi:DnaK suppressor protein
MAPKTPQKPTSSATSPITSKGASSTAAAKKAPAPKVTAKPAKTAAKPTAQPAPKAGPAPAAKPAAKKASSPPPAPGKTTAKTAPAKPAPIEAPKPPAAKNQKWDEIRLQLLQLKDATLREISRSIKSGSEAKVGEETTGDIYDQASSERDRELELILSDRERQKLHNIDDALLRMDEGEYGICEECDEDIPLGRLKAMPFTRHCVKCKSDLERLQAQTRRFEEDRAYREIPLGDEEEG